MSNHKRITGHFFTAENQNGFNQALYEFFNISPNDDGFYTKKEIKAMVCSYPKQYPCAFVIVDKTSECARIFIKIVDLTSLKL